MEPCPKLESWLIDLLEDWCGVAAITHDATKAAVLRQCADDVAVIVAACRMPAAARRRRRARQATPAQATVD